jgi:sacsin
MSLTPQEQVVQIYQQKTSNDALARDLSGALKIISDTVFGQVKHIIHELLQNADDAPISVDKSIEVEIRLFQNYLIFSHTGRHFSEDDVDAISSIGSGESRKTIDIEKTGFKGVGFKAVFGRASCVYVISNHYSFRFDKSHWADRLNYPWQVIPIWTDENELPEELNNLLDRTRVNIVLRLNEINLLHKELLELFQKPLLMLFLRNVNRVTINKDNQIIHDIKKQHLENGHLGITDRGKLFCECLTRNWNRNVPESLRTELNNLPDHICPPKIKNAFKSTLTLAIFVKEGKLETNYALPIYCYLPTSLTLDFPFLINGDFLTNAERTDLLLISWNSFLLGEVAQCLFDWMEELAGNKQYQLDAPALIRLPSNEKESKQYLKEYNNIFKQNFLQKKFIVSQSGENIMSISNALLDQSDISKIVPERYLVSLFSGIEHIAHSDITGKGKLKALGCKEFGIDQLQKLIESPLFVNDFYLTLFKISQLSII